MQVAVRPARLAAMGGNGESAGFLAVAVAGTAAVLLAARAARRSLAARVRCRLACECGRVRGALCALPEDVKPVLCFCRSCREYARWLATRPPGAPGARCCMCVVRPDTGTSLVMCSKADVSLEQGLEWVQVCAKDATSETRRFFARCCNTPLFTTGESLGWLAVPAACLDDSAAKFGEPKLSFIEFAEKPVAAQGRELLALSETAWFALRNAPYAGAGPKLDYGGAPKLYWGGTAVKAT